uniref:coiled-coil domain-containing protein 42 homolog n=1 Tax=Scatophagus argus TaxID=75038 RepID=UPI001ED7FA83|nr:coiled-coil domain-containing protein 42 homolog [Scatophagus argus]
MRKQHDERTTDFVWLTVRRQQSAMDVRGARDEQETQSLPPGESAVITAHDSSRTAALVELNKKLREKEDLEANKDARQQVLQSLQQRRDDLQKKIEEVKELYTASSMFKKAELDQAVEKAEREKKEGFEKEANIKRLKEQYDQLMLRQQEQQQQMQSYTPHLDLMERVVKMVKFKDVLSLMGHLENLLHFRDQFCQQENEAQEQINYLRKALLTLEDQQRLMRLYKNNQLSQLHKELEKTRSEAVTWESRWDHIVETSTKKTLQLVQIRMAILNLYEMTHETAEGEDSVDMNDTEEQLDKVKNFIQDHSDIVKQHQALMQRHSDEQTKTKKHIVTHCKKD